VTQRRRLDADGAIALLHAVIAGDADAVIDLIGAESILDMPRLARAVAADGIRSSIAVARAAYPYELIDVRQHHAIETPNGVVVELRARLRDGGNEIALPLAVVDSVEDGNRTVRIYHSERIPTGVRRGRRAVFPVDEDASPTLATHPGVRAYMEAIGTGDPDAILLRFADDAVLDNGVRPVTDRGELRAIVTAMARSGGVRLVRRREFDDGSVVAFEYTGLPRPSSGPQAPRTPPGGGIGVYTVDARGRIVSVRMYDDFDPDALIVAGSQTADSDHPT